MKENILSEVKNDFIRVQTEHNYTDREKVMKYASLMTMLERYCDVPAVEQDIQDQQSPEIVLYKQIAEERNKYL